MIRICLLAALLPVVLSQSVRVANDDSAHCVDSVPAFFASENTELATSTSVNVEGVSERQCITMCTDNADLSGRPLICASAAYDKTTKTCHVYRVKSRPDGLLHQRAAFGKRYFEKFCLPSSAPFTCGESLFTRHNQKVLVGFAKNVSVETSLAGCVRQCIDEPYDCKSAAYFYEDGECITNRATASESPDTFLDEETDKVIYFENGCSQTNQPLIISDNNAAVIRQKPSSRRPSVTRRITHRPTATTTEEPTTTTTVSATTTIPREFRHRSGYSKWSGWTPCDRPDGRRVRRRRCERTSGECTMPLLHVQWCRDVDARFLVKETTTTAPTTTNAPTTTTVRAAVVRNNRIRNNSQPRLADIPTKPDESLNEIPIEMQGWGVWTVDCQAFVTKQPCEDGEMIGFQTRNCDGNPFQCQGTFFRYCTLACEGEEEVKEIVETTTMVMEEVEMETTATTNEN